MAHSKIPGAVTALATHIAGELVLPAGGELPAVFVPENAALTHLFDPHDPQSAAGAVGLLTDRQHFSAQSKAPTRVCVCERKLWLALSEAQRQELQSHRYMILVEHGRRALVELLHYFYPQRAASPCVPGIHPTACIESDSVSSEAEIGPFVYVQQGAVVEAGCVVSAHSVIGAEVQIGKDCRIAERVVIKAAARVEQRVIIGPGTVIGSEGYGFYRDQQTHHKIPQVGTVHIENDVEIGANVTIDRATVGVTRIGEGTKMDNLVQIGHNVRIGKRCLIVAQVGISGSTTLGDDVILAGQTGVAGHLHIGDGAIASGKTGITRDIPAGQHVSGHPVMPHREYLKLWAKLKRK